MQGNELRDRIKRGETDGIYLFAGEEDYLKRHYLGELRRAVLADEALAPFVHFVFEGASIDFSALMDAVATPSMMSDKKLVEWHLANFEAMKEKDLAALEAFLAEAKEYEGNTVVFVATPEGFDAGTDRRPSKLARRLGTAVDIVLFPKSTDAQLAGWIARHFAAEKLAHTPSLPQAMVARIGHSMDILLGEIDKLVCFAKANGIECLSEREMEYVTVQTVESDAFSLSNALLDGRVEDAYRFLGDMKRRRVDPIAILGQVSRLYGDMLSVAILAEEGMSPKEISQKLKMHEYKTGLYLKAGKKSGVAALEGKLLACAEIDSTMKNGISSYIGLERLIAESAAR